jgi:hypothetical protein
VMALITLTPSSTARSISSRWFWVAPRRTNVAVLVVSFSCLKTVTRSDHSA